MGLKEVIKTVEKYRKKSLKFTLKEYLVVDNIRTDLLYLSQILQKTPSNSNKQHYVVHIKHLIRRSTRITRRLNYWVKNLKKILLDLETISPRDRKEIEKFITLLESFKNKLVKSLAHDGELERAVFSKKQDWAEIKRIVSNILGDNRNIGIVTLLKELKDLEHMEERIERKSLERGMNKAVDHLNSNHAGTIVSSAKDFLSNKHLLDKLTPIQTKQISKEGEKSRKSMLDFLALFEHYGLVQPLGKPVYFRVNYDLPSHSYAWFNPAFANIIETSDPNKFSRDGQTIAEELGHYFRYVYYPQGSNDVEVHEFFGFLARRMILSVISRSRKSHFFPKGIEGARNISIDMEVERIHEQLAHQRERIKNIDQIVLKSKSYREGDMKGTEAVRRVQLRLSTKRIDSLLSELDHLKGYYYAKFIDLTK
ncbi:hypothetical protein HOK09_04960, partial [Candidatus Woesearchaeota archaeon]|nr:hypothetical protein [Candidatus Woesearchaeota archaeon]